MVLKKPLVLSPIEKNTQFMSSTDAKPNPESLNCVKTWRTKAQSIFRRSASFHALSS